jgi:hypothetical protein
MALRPTMYAQAWVTRVGEFFRIWLQMLSGQKESLNEVLLRAVFNLTPRGELWPLGVNFSPKG